MSKSQNGLIEWCSAYGTHGIEKVVRYANEVYGAWKGGTMEDVRWTINELGKSLHEAGRLIYNDIDEHGNPIAND